MNTMSAWWGTLAPLNQWMYVIAIFFGIITLWQLLMAVLGIGSTATDLDSHVDAGHTNVDDAHDTTAAFKLFSVRSILAFFTLFTWAAALYMTQGLSLSSALPLSLVWGVAAMLLVSTILFGMKKLTGTGNQDIRTTLGAVGTVYLDIPDHGVGEVRLLCSGVMTHMKATTPRGTAIKAGAQVRVVKATPPNTVEVEPC